MTPPKTKQYNEEILQKKKKNSNKLYFDIILAQNIYNI